MMSFEPWTVVCDKPKRQAVSSSLLAQALEGLQSQLDDEPPEGYVFETIERGYTWTAARCGCWDPSLITHIYMLVQTKGAPRWKRLHRPSFQARWPITRSFIHLVTPLLHAFNFIAPILVSEDDFKRHSAYRQRLYTAIYDTKGPP